jgi:predicted DCC family thiol-disulfide oxidoreductase YuxK
MEHLTVLFDGDCASCEQIAERLDHAAQWVPLRMIDARSPEARAHYASIPWLGAELVVVADDGRIWAGPAAFLVTGWALRSTRWLAELAMGPLLLPLACALFDWISANRGWWSARLGGPGCQSTQCLARHAPAVIAPTPYR